MLFPTDYADARERFRELVSCADFSLESHAHPTKKGPNGEALACELTPSPPGVVETPMIRQAGMDPARLKLFLDRIPMHRFAKPEEIVGPAQFLASSTAAYVTGVILPVDGGFLAM